MRKPTAPEPPPFALPPHPGSATALDRIAVAQIDYALRMLGHEGAAGVHEPRKVCKRVRALLRLVRRTRRRGFRRHDRRLRDAARALSASRDTTVLAASSEALAARDDRLEPLASWARRLRPGRRGDGRAQARRLLRAERAALVLRPIGDVAIPTLLAGVLDDYRRARRGYRRARRRPDAAALHDWRRRVKYHACQCRLLAPIWPQAGRQAARLAALADLLGEHHDLEVLAASLQRKGFAAGREDLARRARRQVGARQQRLVHAALDTGRSLFADTPLDWLRHTA